MTDSVTLADEKMVSVKEIKPDMVLSRDVVTSGGTVLLAKNTMLNGGNYPKLLSSGVGYIYVISGSIDEKKSNFTEKERQAASLEQQRRPIVKRPEFISFQNAVDDKVEEAKQCIRAISDGKNIDLQRMFSITDDIMSTLRCKNDILTFVGFIKESDEHTFHHSINVSLLANLYGRWLALSNNELVELTIAGLLHDIGKTRTPNEILNKKGRLTDEEFTVMKKHPISGYRILQNQDIPESIKLGALMHHEKLDGSGYPMGAKGEQIGKIAKIIAICDIYDAMTANRVYRDKICPFEVIKMFESKVYGELDTQYLLIFLNNIAYTYIGSWVKLTDGVEAEVVFINSSRLSSPIVRTVDDRFIDLSFVKSVSIDSLV
ncbi:MAG: HD-GYP domain-containing protein [Clostridiales bacterium]|jgi:putative nucleotidyltransferase with HDIG domain|nr:HD-GYP domain-containing protein [Clostridiales bacterium]